MKMRLSQGNVSVELTAPEAMLIARALRFAGREFQFGASDSSGLLRILGQKEMAEVCERTAEGLEYSSLLALAREDFESSEDGWMRTQIVRRMDAGFSYDLLNTLGYPPANFEENSKTAVEN